MIIRKLSDRKPKIVIFNGSPRRLKSCANQTSKTQKLVEYVIEKYLPFVDFDVIDLSVGKVNIQPCKGCISTSNGFHCVSKGERIETLDGFKKIEDISVGDKLSTGTVQNAWLSKHDAECFEVTISDGRKIRLTDNHPIKIIEPIYKDVSKKNISEYIESWVEVKDLKVGQRVPFIFEKIEKNDIIEDLDAFKISGLIWGDGSFKSGRLRLCYDVRDSILFNYLNDNYNIKISKGVESKNTTVNWISFNDEFLNLKLNNLILEEKSKPVEQRRLPLSIMNASKSQISNFLNGWFATDGSIIKRNISGNIYYEINLTSVSDDSLRDCQILLSKFGIKSSISYLKHIKTVRFNKVLPRTSMLIISGKNANIFMSEIGIFNKKDKFEFINYKNAKKKYYGKIEKIKYIGNSDVYDLTISDSHKFICEGIEVHNCHFPCSCFSKGSKVQTDLMYEADIYDKLEECDAFVVVSPIHWYSVSTQVKAMFDRLVCANQTITKEQAEELFGEGNIKNSELTGNAEIYGQHKHLLKNHLKGKWAAFYVHGDDGANDYDGNPPHTGDKAWDVKNSVMPLVYQCRYSEINCPDDLVEAFYINQGKAYYQANLDMPTESEFFIKMDNLMEKLLSYLN